MPSIEASDGTEKINVSIKVEIKYVFFMNLLLLEIFKLLNRSLLFVIDYTEES